MTILSFLAALLTLASVYLIGRRMAVGHLIGLTGSLTWIIVSWGHDWPLTGLNAVFVALYIKNWLAWR